MIRKLTFFCVQISLERMDELFGGADLADVEDVGVAARQAEAKADLEKSEVTHTSKV